MYTQTYTLFVVVSRARAGSDQHLDVGEDYAGTLQANAVPAFVVRKASLCVFQKGFQALEEGFAALLKTVRVDQDTVVEKLPDGRELVLRQDVQVLHVVLKLDMGSSDSLSDRLSAFLQSRQQELKQAGVRRITFAVPPADQTHEVISGHGSSFFTFRRRTGWREDRLVRHIEPSLAYQLDLKRLSNFNISRVPMGKRDLSARYAFSLFLFFIELY
jgi:hypothetical protein